MVRDEAIKQPNAPARGPRAVDLARRRAESGSRNIEMRPRRAIDEALEELSRGDRAGMSSAGVFHIGEFGVDQLVVGRFERHAPNLFSRGFASLGEAVRQFIVVGEKARALMAQ